MNNSASQMIKEAFEKASGEYQARQKKETKAKVSVVLKPSRAEDGQIKVDCFVSFFNVGSGTFCNTVILSVSAHSFATAVDTLRSFCALADSAIVNAAEEFKNLVNSS